MWGSKNKNITTTKEDLFRSKRDRVMDKYHKYVWTKWLFIMLSLVLVIVTFAFAITIGNYPIDFFEVYEIIWNHLTGNITDPTKDLIVWTARLPRVLTAAIAGAGLAACGAAMQSVMKNPLSDPYLTGMSSGAALGATLGVIAGFTIIGGQYAIVMNAFLFSLIPMGIILLISKMRSTSPTLLILSGVAVMYIFNSITTLLMLAATPEDSAAVYSFQVGTLSRATWDAIPVMTFFTTIGMIALMLLSGKINIMSLGDESAKTLGVDAEKLRIRTLTIISLTTAGIVSFTGIIGFVGLVCPHVVRLFLGSDNRYLIPASALFGVFMLLIADIIARTIIAPVILQVGVVTAFIGGPLFLYLLIRQRKEVW